MKTLAVIGYPIAHSLSPAMYNAAFPVIGYDARYEAWPTPAESLAATVSRVRDENMPGMNVTVPHKQSVMPLLDEIEPLAASIGAVNCIVNREGRLIGHNTDRPGFIRSLREAGCNPDESRVLILGAGGSSRAVAFGLLEAGANDLVIAARSKSRAEELIGDLRNWFAHAALHSAGWHDASFADATRNVDLIVNCTPIGMRHSEQEHASPLPAELLRPHVWVYDLVYNPRETPLLRDARQAGARPIGGLAMLVYQAAESITLWTGREAPVDIMLEAAESALIGAT